MMMITSLQRHQTQFSDNNRQQKPSENTGALLARAEIAEADCILLLMPLLECSQNLKKRLLNTSRVCASERGRRQELTTHRIYDTTTTTTAAAVNLIAQWNK